MMFLSVRCLIIYWVPVGAAANSSWDANTVLTCGKTNRTVQSGQSFIFLSSSNAIHSHPDAASTTDISSTCDTTQNPAPGTGRSGNGILDRQGGKSTPHCQSCAILKPHCLSHSTHQHDRQPTERCSLAATNSR